MYWLIFVGIWLIGSVLAYVLTRIFDFLESDPEDSWTLGARVGFIFMSLCLTWIFAFIMGTAVCIHCFEKLKKWFKEHWNDKVGW